MITVRWWLGSTSEEVPETVVSAVGATLQHRLAESPLGLSPGPGCVAEVGSSPLPPDLSLSAAPPLPAAGAPARQRCWREFVRQHVDQILATDFFLVDTVWVTRLSVLFLIDAGSLPVHLWVPCPAGFAGLQQSRRRRLLKKEVHQRRLGRLALPNR